MKTTQQQTYTPLSVEEALAEFIENPFEEWINETILHRDD